MNILLNPNNQLFELARSGRRLPHIILAIVLTFVFIVVAQISGVIGFLFLAGIQLISFPPTTALDQTSLLLLGFAPIFLVIWVWLRLFEKRSLWTIGMVWGGAWQKYLKGLLVGFSMFVASIGISAVLGFIAFETGNPQQQGLAALGGVLLVFVGWTIQGPAEEALTRGWLLQVIGARYTPLLGVIVSSLIFALLHSLNFLTLEMEPIYIGLSLLNLFLFGLFAALYALYEGGLWGVFSIHAVWNWVQGNIFGFEVSGAPAPGGTLFNLMEVGPDAITGGSFGPEGGLSVTIVLVISCVIVWIFSRQKKGQ